MAALSLQPVATCPRSTSLGSTVIIATIANAAAYMHVQSNHAPVPTTARCTQITKCLQNLPDDQQAPSLSTAVPHIWTDLPGSTRPPESHSSSKLPKRIVDLSGTRAMGSSLPSNHRQQQQQQCATALSTQCGSCLVMGLATPPTPRALLLKILL